MGGGGLGGWGLGCVFAILQKKVFILLVTHDHRVFFFAPDEIEFGGSDLGM